MLEIKCSSHQRILTECAKEAGRESLDREYLVNALAIDDYNSKLDELNLYHSDENEAKYQPSIRAEFETWSDDRLIAEFVDRFDPGV